MPGKIGSPGKCPVNQMESFGTQARASSVSDDTIWTSLSNFHRSVKIFHPVCCIYPFHASRVQPYIIICFFNQNFFLQSIINYFKEKTIYFRNSKFMSFLPISSDSGTIRNRLSAMPFRIFSNSIHKTVLSSGLSCGLS
jgi:hypothetical protein